MRQLVLLMVVVLAVACSASSSAPGDGGTPACECSTTEEASGTVDAGTVACDGGSLYCGERTGDGECWRENFPCCGGTRIARCLEGVEVSGEAPRCGEPAGGGVDTACSEDGTFCVEIERGGQILKKRYCIE